MMIFVMLLFSMISLVNAIAWQNTSFDNMKNVTMKDTLKSNTPFLLNISDINIISKAFMIYDDSNNIIPFNYLDANEHITTIPTNSSYLLFTANATATYYIYYNNNTVVVKPVDAFLQWDRFINSSNNLPWTIGVGAWSFGRGFAEKTLTAGSYIYSPITGLYNYKDVGIYSKIAHFVRGDSARFVIRCNTSNYANGDLITDFGPSNYRSFGDGGYSSINGAGGANGVNHSYLWRVGTTASTLWEAEVSSPVATFTTPTDAQIGINKFNFTCMAGQEQGNGTFDNWAVWNWTLLGRVQFYNNTCNNYTMGSVQNYVSPNNFAVNMILFNTTNNSLSNISQNQFFWTKVNFTNNGVSVGNGSICIWNASDLEANFVSGISNYTFFGNGNYDLNITYLHGTSSQNDSFVFRICETNNPFSRNLDVYINNVLYQTISSAIIPSCIAGFREVYNQTFLYNTTSYFNISLRCPTCNSGNDLRLIVNSNNNYVLKGSRKFIPYANESTTYNDTSKTYDSLSHYHSFPNNATNYLSMNCNNTNLTLSYNTGYISMQVMFTDVQDDIYGNRTFLNGTNVSSVIWLVKGGCSNQIISETYINLSYSNGTFIGKQNGEVYSNGAFYPNNTYFNITFFCRDIYGNGATATGNFYQIYNPSITFIIPTLPNNSVSNQNPLIFNFTNNLNASSCYLMCNLTNSSYVEVNSSICSFSATYNYTANFTGNYNFSIPTMLNQTKFLVDANYTMYNRSIVFAYNFNNLIGIGENTGLVVDIGFFGHNATVNGTNFTTAGKYDGGINSTGQVSSLTLADTQHLSFTTGKFTLLFWAKMATDDQSTVKSILNKLAEINIQIETDEKLNIYTSNDGVSSYQVVKTTNAISGLSGWKYYAIVISGASSKIYIDNVDTPITITNVGSTIVDGGKEVRLFQISTDNTSRYDGLLDDIILFNRTLSVNEISRYYYSSLKKVNSTLWNFLSTENGRFCF